MHTSDIEATSFSASLAAYGVRFSSKVPITQRLTVSYTGVKSTDPQWREIRQPLYTPQLEHAFYQTSRWPLEICPR